MSADRLRMGFASASTAAVLMLATSLIQSELRVYSPYRDVFGVLTACAGITGPDVVADKVYTDAECERLERAYIERMLARLGRCVARDDLALHQVVAWGHFAYNVGNDGFCASAAAKLLNARRDAEACEQVMRWVYGRSRRTGQLIDCRIQANNCYGLVNRRIRERAMCLGDMNAFKAEWQVPA